MPTPEQLRSHLRRQIDLVDQANTANREDITVRMGPAPHRAQGAADHSRIPIGSMGNRVTAMMREIQEPRGEVRNVTCNRPRTKQAGAVSRRFAR
jgi:hypothetical protein